MSESTAHHLLGIYQTRLSMAERGVTHPKPEVVAGMRRLVAGLSAMSSEALVRFENHDGKWKFRVASTGDLLVEFDFTGDAARQNAVNLAEDASPTPPIDPVWPEGAVGEYASLLQECGTAATERGLVPVFVPSLAAILLKAERSRTTPFTEEDAIAIRDRCSCTMVPPAVAEAMAEKRGYIDIDPERCWEEFSDLKNDLNEHEST